MTLKDRIDTMATEMSKIRETVEAHKDNPADLDMELLTGTVKGLVDEQIKAQQAERESEPIRKGEWVGPEGAKERSLGRVEDGKYAGYKASDVLWAGAQMRKHRKDFPDNVQAETPEMTKLMTATTTDAGDEWVPTGMAAELWQDMFAGSRVVDAVGTIPMPTDPFEMPGWATVTFRKATGGEATAAQDPETHKSTLTSTELIAEINWNYDLEEDSLLAVLPAVRQELSRAGSEFMDKFCINADGTAAATGNINMDDATPATDSYYLSGGQDGIRHYYIVDDTGQSANISTTLTDPLWRAGVARLGKYGVDVGNLACFTNIQTYLLSMISLTGVRTLDKYGPSATIATGELGKMDGIPIIPTDAIALAEDDGKVCKTPGSNDEGQIALVHRPSWRVGFKRQLLIEMERDIRKRMFIMVASFRIAIGCRDNGKGSAREDGHTAGIHGIAYS